MVRTLILVDALGERILLNTDIRGKDAAGWVVQVHWRTAVAQQGWSDTL